MKLVILGVLALLFAAPVLASQEQIHHWKSITITASTDKFGDVEMKATADAKGNLATLDITFNKKTITVPAKWIATLPPMPLSSIEIRTEPGRDPKPWLYAFFRNGPRDVKGSIDLHISIHGDKLDGASTTTHEGKGASKWVQIKAP